ncbi:hypothetical protein PACTADRAFT_55668 [Pachysolen tannophilus NRRL Y-2460]|uniref:Receptor L-domain domain-containing protein n=1 Tax=Pachysolen tannophilus NRRL Y-2460 TaxID=669874 RepID=A0A1E4TZU6_PACTA|nr:hypothetical protein PACTADRAFT_55668 [Pachysolen tannophilus NRRL Y-2460]
MRLNSFKFVVLLTWVANVLKFATCLAALDSDAKALIEEISSRGRGDKPDSIKHTDGKQQQQALKPDTDSYFVQEEIPEHCSKDHYYINSSADLSEIADCETISGTISITDYEGSFLNLGDIKHIRGSLIIKNAHNLVRIEGIAVQNIASAMWLQELTSLTSLYFPSLVTVNEIYWKVLPILTTVSFDTGIQNVNRITVSDTSLTGFSGFDVEKLEKLDVNNNRFLESVDSQVKKVSEELSIAANAKNVVVKFPQLTWANNITVRDVSSLDIGSLEEVEASIGFIDNLFSSLKAPKLKNVGGTLMISENEILSDVQFPNLTQIGGGLMIVNNTEIDKINFFPNLQAIGGAIKFSGDFKDFSFSKLRLVKGSASIKTTSDNFDCSRWMRTDATAFVRGGKIECAAAARTSETIHVDKDGIVTGSISGKESGIGSSSSDASESICRPATFILLSVLTLNFFYLLAEW